MKDIIQIFDHNGQSAVSARELHTFLEVKTPFDKWMPRMLEYGFIDGLDFSTILSESTGGRPSKDYALTIDTAKEISMIQRTEKGKQARQYFIECEKIAINPLSQNGDLLVLQAIKHLESKIEAQNKQLQKQAPQIEFLNRVLDTDEKIDIGQAAKILNLPFGRNILFKNLREKGVFFKNRNEPLQKYIDKGYFELKEKWIDRNNHDSFLVIKVLVTQRGLGFLSTLFESVQKTKKLAKIS